MKTNFLKQITCLLAIASLSLTACTDHEVLEMSEGRAISFKNAVMTKAAHMASGEFNVVAYKGTAGSMSNTQVFSDTYRISTNEFGTTASRYYDGISSYWFFGYAQAVAGALTKFTTTDNVTFPATGAPSIDFTTPATANLDLVTMASGEVVTGSQGGAKNIVFKHALSRVRFTASTTTADANNPVIITGVTFKVSKNTGTISATGFAGGVTAMAATGTTAATYTMSSLSGTALTTSSNDVTDGQKLYVVPQPLGTDALVVTYTIGGTAGSKTFDLSTTTMYSGSAYVFDITVAGLNAITFTATVDNWADVTETTVGGNTLP